MAIFDQRHQVVITQHNIAQGISEEQYQRLAEELGVTRSALRSFFQDSRAATCWTSGRICTGSYGFALPGKLLLAHEPDF
jgi:hypothetical protein